MDACWRTQHAAGRSRDEHEGEAARWLRPWETVGRTRVGLRPLFSFNFHVFLWFFFLSLSLSPVCVCVCVLLAVARGLFKQVALCAVISLEIPTLMAATRHPFYLLIFTIRLARLVAFLRLVFFLRRRLR